jgi:hypothetical protein
MSQNVKGNFASASSSNLGQTSDVLVIPSGVTSMLLTLGGTIDASNTAKTQKSTNSGQTWVDQTTYNSAQTNVAVTVAAGEQWRVAIVTQQPLKQLHYGMSVES